MKKIPPYYHNFDGIHCLQSALRSTFGYFAPEKNWTWSQLEKLTNMRPKSPTWPMGFLSKLNQHGYEAVIIEHFDYEKFSKNPKNYLENYFSAEQLPYVHKGLDLEQELKATLNLLKAQAAGHLKIIQRNSTAADIKKYLGEGYLIIHWVNSRALMQREGNVGHFVLIYDKYDEKTVTLHDSGGVRALPPKGQPVGMAEWKVNIQHLLKSATDDGKTGGFYAIRSKQ
jgi:hypothetical protein